MGRWKNRRLELLNYRKKIMDKKFAVIFDMDGVLVENSGFHDRAWQMICKKYNSKKTPEEIKSIFGGTNNLFVAKLLGITDDEEIKVIAEEKEALYREIYNDFIQLPDGLFNLLNELKQNNIPMAVATSAPTVNLDFVLDKLKISSYFEVLVDESFVKHGKPDPEIYRVTAQRLNIAPENCIVIEDSIFGIQSAKANGMKVIGITTTFNLEQINFADLVIKSFKEIDLQRINLLMNNGSKLK
jgi:beta-phosphoglucomutase family hydrolase